MPRDVDSDLRPSTLDEIIGLQRIKDSLKVFLAAAAARNEPLDHVLLRGQPGLGKTTLALAIANALGYELVTRTGPVMSMDYLDGIMDQYLIPHPALLKRLLPKDREHKLNAKYVIFIDEIHSVPKETFELLYPMLEQFEYKGMKLPSFTLIGATTDAGKLPTPFVDRFGINYMIDYYPDEDIEAIVNRSHRALTGHEIESTVAEALSIRSRGTPRRANRLLKRCLDYMQQAGADTLSESIVTVAMRSMGVDRFGLEDADRRLLVAMLERFNRPVGIAALASAIGEDIKTIEHSMEPYLVRQGFINREARGRVLGPQGEMLAAMTIDGEVPY